MATATERRRSTPDPPGGRPVGAGRDRPVGGFEFWMWLYMRISGLLLLVLAVGHVLIMHVVDEGVGRVDFGFVATRWASPFWRTWDWLMLLLALTHGINGLRVIVLDYVRPAGVRFAANMIFYVTGLVLFALGTVIVFTFDPSKWPGAT
ncbi:MAG TPA: succinate dehydrogenase hydrophobic membrane anchor subunit [Actinomycetota bacterium]|jgi:succinate dehydrogenase / fumarate reductase membrane anchor subunit|nr:succinate dehydrogenase hydrophobic membrane anchor subunit [Actinomycetota bacterium]